MPFPGKRLLKQYFSHNLSRLLVEPVLVGIGLAIGVFADEAQEQQKQDHVNSAQQSEVNITFDPASRPEIISKVVNIRGLARGEVRSVEEGRAYNRAVEFQQGVEVGSSIGGNLMNLSATVERKLTTEFNVSFGQQVSSVRVSAVSGDSCPNFDIHIFEAWRKGSIQFAALPGRSIPFKFQDGIQVSARNLCDARSTVPTPHF
jgi:hypothetical protein